MTFTRINMNGIYKKAFIFEATRYEEYINGKCIRHGAINCTIVAKPISQDTLSVVLLDDVPSGINQRFGLPIFGIEHGDVLNDRVQYGRLPDMMHWDDPNEPLVCNIFNNMTCIRFAMLSPLRIIEFFGEFTDIREPNQTSQYGK